MPFVNEIVAEDYTSDTEYKTDVFHDFESGIQAIKNLNGGNHSNVFFQGEGGEFLFINGGKDGKFMVNTSNFTNGIVSNLIDPEKSATDLIEIATSGKTSEMYPQNKCTNIETVIKAATYFYETGKHDPELTWDNVNSGK